ncbi:MAG: hypothetical protein ACTH6A_06670 [Brachybacterium tyrofermentans]|uniref:hypothetical protein n=1 Tax=Brachybacterium tyrofermentans TaxID=47848 RepID=UPI003F90D80D
MRTEQTLRRRRGRRIRKARRAARDRRVAPLTLAKFIALVDGGLQRAVDSLAEAFTALWDTACVAAQRLMPLLFTPRDGAGARRQLLDHGRGPSKGGR